MTNLGSDDTPVKGENFSLPAGAQIDEDGGELVVRDTSGEIILRRDETAGNWNFEGGELQNIGSVNTEHTTTEKLSYNFDERWPNSPNQPDVPAPLQLRDHPNATNPVLTGADISAVNADSVADPFICYDHWRTNEFWMFFEVIQSDGNFTIGTARSPDGINWSDNAIAIDETQNEHTHPHIFRHNGSWFIVPSPADTTAQDLFFYKAENDEFPHDWTLVEQTSLGHDVTLDPVVFEFEGTWYVSFEAEDDFEHIYYSDTLLNGNWQEHPDSPDQLVRVSGRPIVYDGFVGVFRRAGGELYQEYWRITPDSLDRRWAQNKENVLEPSAGEEWRSSSMHHVDPLIGGPQGNSIAVVDGHAGSNDWKIAIWEFGSKDPTFDSVSVNEDATILVADDDTNQSFDSGAVDVLTLTTAETDNLGIADVASDKVVIGVDGTYRLSAHVVWQADSEWTTGDRAAPTLAINGVRQTGFRKMKVGTDDQAVEAVPVTKELSEGDEISVEVFQESGSPQLLRVGTKGYRNRLHIERTG